MFSFCVNLGIGVPGLGGFGGLSLFPCGWEQVLGLGMKNSIHVEGGSTPTPKSSLYFWAYSTVDLTLVNNCGIFEL